MGITTEQFWQLLEQSGLIAASRLQELRSEFQAQHPSETKASHLARWLVAQRVITAYHAQVLGAGQPGPFFYGDYLVTARVPWPLNVPLFLARHVPTGHKVTLLFLDQHQAPTAEQMAQLARVTAWAAGVSSPHLLQCYELVSTGNYRFFVLERIRGKTLDAVLRSGPLELRRACTLAKEIALALAHLHQAGQIHGEIRPQNVLVRSEGYGQLIYFPLWRCDPLGPPTNANSPPELLHLAADYLAPEIISGQGISPSADLYSLGCLLYEMLTGQAPFGELKSPQEKVHAHLHTPAAPILTRKASLPRELAQLIDGLLAKVPGQRVPSALHVVEALAPFEEQRQALPKSDPTAVAFQQHVQQRVVAVGQAPPTGSWGAQAPPSVGAGAGVASGPGAGGVSSGGGSAALSGAVGASPAAPPAAPAPGTSPLVAPPGTTTPPMPSSLGDQASDSVSPEVLALRKRKKLRKQITAATTVGVVVTVLVALGWWVSSWSSQAPQTGTGSGQTASSQPTTTKESPSKSASPDSAKSQTATVLRTLQGEPMWASPTQGEPLDLRYLPPGVQVVVSLRPELLLNHEQGKITVELLGLTQQGALEALERIGRVPLHQVELAVVGFLAGPPGRLPRAALILHTKQPLSTEDLLARVPAARRQRLRGHDVVVGGSWGYCVLGRNKLLVAPHQPLSQLGEQESPLEAALAAAEQAPPLPAELEELLPWTDSQRMFNLLASSGFVFASGKELWWGAAQHLRKPVRVFLEDQVRAVLLSVHLDQENLFCEARVVPKGDEPPAVLARKFREKLAQLPQQVEELLAQRIISPYSRRILLRFPRMLEQLMAQTDAGVHEHQVVFRCYLPAVAAPNLLFATYLAVLESRAPASATVAARPQQQKPQSLAEVLKHKIISLSFPRDTLEQSLIMFGQEIGFEVRILGRDLELEGITKNQSFGLDERNKPAGEVLRTILKKANPDGKLIYVIKKEGDREVLIITTRKAAQQRGDPIPAELQQDS